VVNTYPRRACRTGRSQLRSSARSCWCHCRMQLGVADLFYS